MNTALIYTLLIWRFDSDYKYPKFRIRKAEVYYYSSKEQAEERIAEMGIDLNIYCFIIKALPLGRDVFGGSYRCWLYDREGTFVSETLCSELLISGTDEPEELLPGRRPDQCRFKTGDIVEVRNSGIVEIGIILKQPPTPEDIEEMGKKYAARGMPNFMAEDYTEDSYIVMTGKTGLNYLGYYHAYVTDVLPCGKKVSPGRKTELMKLLEDAQFVIEKH